MMTEKNLKFSHGVYISNIGTGLLQILKYFENVEPNIFLTNLLLLHFNQNFDFSENNLKV